MPTEPVTTCDTNINPVVRRLPNGCKSILFILSKKNPQIILTPDISMS